MTRPNFVRSTPGRTLLLTIITVAACGEELYSAETRVAAPTNTRLVTAPSINASCMPKVVSEEVSGLIGENEQVPAPAFRIELPAGCADIDISTMRMVAAPSTFTTPISWVLKANNQQFDSGTITTGPFTPRATIHVSADESVHVRNYINTKGQRGKYFGGISLTSLVVTPTNGSGAYNIYTSNGSPVVQGDAHFVSCFPEGTINPCN